MIFSTQFYSFKTLPVAAAIQPKSQNIYNRSIQKNMIRRRNYQPNQIRMDYNIPMPALVFNRPEPPQDR